jgi:protein-S-isoprenylcysteine O-methyltransferase Ste14
MSIVVLLFAIALWAVVHSWLASMRVKDWARRKFGEGAMRGYRLVYNLLAVLTFFPIVLLMAVLPDLQLYILTGIWSGLAYLGMFVALILLAVGFLQTGPLSFVGLQQLFEGEPGPSKLVTSGLYRRVRHPLYSAGLLFIWLTPVMSLNKLVVFAAATVYIFVGAHFEERKLVREFGLDYIAYQQSTPMIIPGLRFAGMRAKMRKML